ncbi:phosphorylated adapter RNA export protein-like [Lineus longissimus]|uniref:phosphorylated adapter RNA export protein-like n=1 Tax=Lineus longissimus TaxID=88925 RepID=UPI00315D0071
MAAARFSYRGTTSRAIPSSGSEASSSEEEAGTWKRKRIRQSGVEEMEGSEVFHNPNLSSGHSGRQSFKRNNVWGDVVSEQTVNQDLSSFGVGAEADVAHTVSRDVESYKVSKDMLELVNKDIEEGSDRNMEEDGNANAAEDSDKDDIFETKIFGKKCVKDRLGCSSSSRQYRDMDNIDSDDDADSKAKNRRGWRKRERTQEKNEDFNSLLQRYQKEREEIKVGEKRKRERAKRFATKKADEEQVEEMEETPAVTTATAGDEPEVVLKHVMKGLEEDNMKLFTQILDVVGNKKMLDVYAKTLDVEDVGGMMTLDGRRRRTAGGVFIQLLKSDKDVTKEQLDSIFSESQEQWKRKKLKARKMKRKRQAVEAHWEVKKSMLAPGMEDVYRKLLDDQLTSLKDEPQKSQQENNPADRVKMEADAKEEFEETMESVEAGVAAVVTPPPSPEEGSEEGEILD